MEQEKIVKIKELIEQLLAATGLEGRLSVNEDSFGGVLVNVESQEAGYLIGRNGDNLRAVEQLARLLVTRRIAEPLRLSVDVNHYRQEALAALKESAKNLARLVVANGWPRYLPPMNAFERRVVHTALAEVPGIKTASEGEGENRRVVIKPVNS